MIDTDNDGMGTTSIKAKRLASRRGFVTVLGLLFSVTTLATSQSGISYQGRILKPDGSPLQGSNVQFKLQVRAPNASNCLMYEELQALDMRNSNGVFGLTMNDGTGTRTDSTSLGLDRVFANRGNFTFDPTTCSSGSTYTPSVDDGRRLAVSFKDETMTTWEPIPTQTINYVPLAIQAMQLQGFDPTALVRVQDSGGIMGNISPLSNANYNELLALINGTTTQYSKTTQLGGASLPTMASGQVLGWNGTAWISQDPVPPPGSITSTQLSNSLSISTTGTLSSAVNTTRDFKLYAASPSTYAVDIQAPSALSASYALTWPLNAGSANQVLSTDGSGSLTWVPPSPWVTNGANISYNSGNVGIGTTSPQSSFDVESTLTSNSNSDLYGMTSNVSVQPTAAITGRRSALALAAQGNASVSMGQISGLSSYATSRGSGNVGGIYGVLPYADFNGTGTANVVAAGSFGAGANSGTINNIYSLSASIYGVGATVGTMAGLFIDIPLYAGSATNRYGVYLNSPAGSATNDYGFYQAGSQKNYLAGSLGIGTSVPGAKLDVTDSSTTTSAIVVPRAGTFTGTAANGMIRYNTSSTLFEFRQNGAWVNYTTVSDGRLKTNVAPVKNGLQIVNQLNPVFYDWDRRNPKAASFEEKHQLGFIAQEVESVLPEVVNRGEDSYRSLEYGKMVAVVVAAVKEIYSRILGHENRIESLEREHAAQAQKIEELERRFRRIEEACGSK